MGSSLPESITKVIYIDCDTLYINDIRKLYDTQLEDEKIDRNKDFTVKIKAVCKIEGHNGESPILIKFIFHPIENAEFKLEKDLNKDEK